MSGLRPVTFVLATIARWLVGTKAGCMLFAVGVALAAAAAAVIVVAPSPGGSDGAKRRSGTWSGLHNEYAPDQGDYVMEGEPGKGATCRVRGRTGSVSGNGWVFRGDASVAEVSCEGRIAEDGRVSARLKLKKQWSGRVKGIGGDWDETSGSAVCEGDLDGTLSAGGTWRGNCTTDDHKTHASSLTWTLSAD